MFIVLGEMILGFSRQRYNFFLEEGMTGMVKATKTCYRILISYDGC